MNIKLSGIIRSSITDGVGIRYVIFTQGCSHNCKGCHNPETHDYNGGYSVKNLLWRENAEDNLIQSRRKHE